MIEICLFLFYIYTIYFINPKKISKNCGYGSFTPNSIRFKEIQENIQEAEIKYFDLAMKRYAKIAEKIEGKTVIQIQIYGLETLHMKDSSGVFQLAIAKILRDKFNVDIIYPDLRSRYPAEIEYFKQEKIALFSENQFSFDRFYEIISEAKVENPVIICYFSRFRLNAYLNFCGIPWDSEIMKHLVFVTNDNSPMNNIYIFEQKVKDLKWCSEIPIIIDEPRMDDCRCEFFEVQEVVEEAQKICFPSALAVYTQIMSVLIGSKTIVQIQMYGLGHINNKRSNGPLQLAVALKLSQKFKLQYPAISMTSQEPRMHPAEIEYLKSLNITVFAGENFCSSRISSPKNILNPMTIVYCIHFECDAFEEFLEAHWNAEILSQIIFVSNEWPDFPWGKRSGWYSKWCDSMPIIEIFPAYCVTDEERRNWYAFSATNIHTISYENAKLMIKSFG